MIRSIFIITVAVLTLTIAGFSTSTPQAMAAKSKRKNTDWIAEAHRLAGLVENDSEKADMLWAIAEAQSARGLDKDARKTMDEAIAIAKTTKYVNVLPVIAFQLKKNALSDAMASMKLIGEYDSSIISAQCMVAGALLKSGKRAEATKMFSEAWKNAGDLDEFDPGFAYVEVAEARARSGMFREALEDVRKIGGGEDEIGALCVIAKVYAQGGMKAEAEKLLAEAIGLVKSGDGRLDNSESYCYIAELQGILGDRQDALKTLRKAASHAKRVEEDELCSCFPSRDDALGDVVRAMAEQGFIDEARTLAGDIKEEYPRVEALAAVAEGAATYGNAKDAREMLLQLEKAISRSSASDAVLLYPVIKVEVKVAMFTRAIENAKATGWAEDDAVIGIAEALGRCGKTDRLETTYGLLKTEPARVRAWYCIGAAKGLMERGAEAAKDG